jgi:hypothetical protein
MSQRTLRFVVAAAVLAVLARPGAAAAQIATPKVEVAGGYSLLYDSDLGETFPAGWFASVTGNLSDTFGVTGEIGRHSKSLFTDLDLGPTPIDVSFSMFSIAAGPSFAVRGDAATVYGNFLIGMIRGSADVNSSVAGTDISVGANDSAFLMSPGGGVDIRVSDAVAVRVGVNLRLVHFEGGYSGQFQMLTGIVFRGGR